MTEQEAVAAADPLGLPSPSANLCTVSLRRFPLRVWARSQEHYDGLIREFTLLTLGQDDSEHRHHVPARLVGLIDRLTQQYANARSVPDAARDAALAAGKLCVDLTYRTPVEARAATLTLAAMLAEADDYCRAGDELLTLAASPETKAFTDWYLGEFIAQLDGAPPTPWPGSLD